jgi:16S rRNA (cytosine1402-N4)-methyltransferase
VIDEKDCENAMSEKFVSPFDFPPGRSAHLPVLYQEIINALVPQGGPPHGGRARPGGRYVDGTLGAGGHAWGILQASAPDGLLLGLDVDPQALDLARQRLQPFEARCKLVRASYASLNEQLRLLDWAEVNGIVLDLGLSSMQLDSPERGFSFQAEAPLDMRFDPGAPVRALDLVNDLPEAELVEMLFRYGEEDRARQIVRAIVKARPVATTTQLAEVIEAAVGRRPSRKPSKRAVGQAGRPKRKPSIHPATRTFQALRIAVNHELEALESVLPQAVGALATGGRLAVISFHSLEDRIVKQFMRRESRDCLCPPRQPICTCGHSASLREITRKPLQPQAAEIEYNPRARSARLRVAEKIGK